VVGLAVGALVVGTLPAGAQLPLTGGPGAKDTLTVTVTGIAETLPDWVEVNIPIQGTGPNLEGALMAVENRRDRALAALQKEGIKILEMAAAPPSLPSAGLAQMMRNAREAATFQATSSIRVRLAFVDVETALADAARIADVMGVDTEGAAVGFSQVIAPKELVTFGTNDSAGLQQKALANGIAEARRLSEQVAAASGQKAGRILSVQLLGLGDSGLMPVLRMLGQTGTTGMASTACLLSVTFALEDNQ
jgi:uncharacterized protein YggE